MGLCIPSVSAIVLVGFCVVQLAFFFQICSVGLLRLKMYSYK